MKKKDWILIFGFLIFVVALYVVTLFFSDDVEYRIIMAVVFFALWLVFTVFVVLYRVLPKRGRETLEIKLSRQGFNAQKVFHYTSDMAGINVTLYVDFDSKQLASNLFYNNVIPFSRVANGRVEFLPYGINTNKSIVHYVISIYRKDSENKFDYIELYNTVVENTDLSDNDEITEQMVVKYPSLREIVELDGVIKQIMEVNKSDGFDVSEVDSDSWEKDSDPDEIDYDPNENSYPNYTKPPFWNKKW